VKKASRSRPKRRRVQADLTPREAAMLRKIHRYVISYCGKVPPSEAIKFVVRDWYWNAKEGGII
jgi:hypothetical protein